jgi:lipoprotein-anchoring transpeptidase ErfK/SrfK
MKILLALLSLPLMAVDSPYSIEVSVQRCRLWLRHNGALVREYGAGTALRGVPHPTGAGAVQAVYFKPSWHPMPGTHKYYREKKNITLPATVPYGHPEHMLGEFKMVLTHRSSVYGPGAYSIHGCKNEQTIGRRVSGGCVRMKNAEGVELAQLVQNEMRENRTVRVTIREN